MKKTSLLRKALVMICSMALIACISVAATIAYFTDSDAVTNTFTVGEVGISLDEAKVNSEGQEITDADRVQANAYHLIPGRTYDKDPTVHVDSDSEDCWIFVKVVNGIAAIEGAAEYVGPNGEKATGTIAEQMTAFGWVPVEGAANIYAYNTPVAENADVVVFKNFKIDGVTVINGTPVPATDSSPALYSINNYRDAEVNVTAYAIQAAGFGGEEGYKAAWAAYASQNPNY